MANRWRLVQTSTGRVIRTFGTEEDAVFYQRHDSLYPTSKYAVQCLALCESPDPLAYHSTSTKDLRLVCTAAQSKSIWRSSPEFCNEIQHGLSLALIALGWHQDSATGLIANAEFCF